MNETKFPHIVEIAVTSDELDLELSRRIMAFHKSRRIEPRNGRINVIEGQSYFRWCFSDLATALDFIDRCGGKLVQANDLHFGP
jgi:hypothetical protein